MIIISCDGCGVLFDKDKLSFPSDDWDYDDDKGYIIPDDKGTWSVRSRSYVAYVKCPVCGDKILEDDE